MNNWWQAYYFQDDWKVSSDAHAEPGPALRVLSAADATRQGDQFRSQRILPRASDLPRFPRYPRHRGPSAGAGVRRPATTSVRASASPGRPEICKDFVIRGGYGIYFTPEITNSWTTLTLNPPIVQTFSFTGNAANPDQPGDRVPVAGLSHARTRSAPERSTPICAPATRSNGTSPSRRSSPENFYFDLGYVGSKGTNLTATYDGNRPIDDRRSRCDHSL